MLDKVDKSIIKLLLKYKETKLTINKIAKKVEVSPITAKKHIMKLEKKGYVIMEEGGKPRTYKTK